MENFVDIFGEIVTAVRAEYDPTGLEKPYYLYGHPIEIFNILALKSESESLKYSKYPLICLFQDFEEQMQTGRRTVDGLTIAIVSETSSEYLAHNRYDNVFVPTLLPIYELLIKHIKNSKYVSNDDLYLHTKIDRLYWGKSDEFGNTANKTNDKLDAVVITDLVLEVNECITI